MGGEPAFSQTQWVLLSYDPRYRLAFLRLAGPAAVCLRAPTWHHAWSPLAARSAALAPHTACFDSASPLPGATACGAEAACGWRIAGGGRAVHQRRCIARRKRPMGWWLRAASVTLCRLLVAPLGRGAALGWGPRTPLSKFAGTGRRRHVCRWPRRYMFYHTPRPRACRSAHARRLKADAPRAHTAPSEGQPGAVVARHLHRPCAHRCLGCRQRRRR